MPTAPRAGRSTWQLLTDRRFGSFILGKTLAFVGVWIHNVVAAVLAWQITSSATWVAVVSVVQFLPQVLLAPVVGPMTDRANQGRMVAAGRAFCFSGSAGLGLWVLAAGVDGLGLPVLLVATCVVGVGFAVSGPAMQAMIPDLVEPDELGRAVGIDSLPTMLGRAAGPAIGALLAAFVGSGAALVTAAGGHLAFGLIAMSLARGEVPRARVEGGGFLDGLSYIRRNPVVILLLLGVTAVGMGADPVVTLAPAMADGHGVGEEFVGYFGSAFGVGAVLGSLVATTANSGRHAPIAPVLGLLVLGGGLASIPLMSTAWTVCACFLVAGVGFTMALSGCTTRLHQVVPPSMRGRVMSLWLIAFMGTRPLAAMVNGLLADAFGTGAALVVMGAYVATTAGLCLPGVLQRATRPEVDLPLSVSAGGRSRCAG
ncbi:MFS transporter [Janibacter alittae]|uniref:MFS transporter n=1 Tax=Janibacter alittae TaxID=3115209 RepID=A0ABZ2MG31_9MICO